MILTIILVSLLAVSTVSAADNATEDVASVEETTDEVVSVEENQAILNENNDVGTFNDLQTEIDNATEDSVLNLTRDYNGAYNSKIQLDKDLTIDGQAVLDVILDAGNYAVVATYLGDDVFNTNTTSQNFEVVGHVKMNTNITTTVNSTGDNVTIAVHVNSNATGFVELNISGSAVYLKLENGSAIYNSMFVDGSYSFVATYLGDENYNTNDTSGSFKVLKTIKTTLISSKVNTVYNGGRYLIVGLKDENGNTLTGVSFKVSINGKNYVIKTNGWGLAKLSTNNLAPKTYTAVITFDGTEKYLKTT